MDDKEYLEQLASTVRPAKKPKTSFMSSAFFKVGLVGVVGIILIALLGAILNSLKVDTKIQAIELKLHLDNTSEIIADFQKSVKSSDLRSSGALLYSVLTNTSRDLTEYLTEKYEYKDGSEDKKIVEQATLEKDALEADLSEAKINGTLDRIFALKMKYEISLLMSEEVDLFDAVDDASLKDILESSYSSLDTILSKLEDFSETK